MAFSAAPDNIEEKVLRSIRYTTSYDVDDIDEFTVRKYTDSLLRTKANKILTPEQYSALIRCFSRFPYIGIN